MRKFIDLVETVAALSELAKNETTETEKAAERVDKALSAFKDEYLGVAPGESEEAYKDKAISYLYRAIEIFRMAYGPDIDSSAFREDFSRAFRLVEEADGLLDLVDLSATEDDPESDAVLPGGPGGQSGR
jgi:glycyl-tRNA synthetase beta subunit